MCRYILNGTLLLVLSASLLLTVPREIRSDTISHPNATSCYTSPVHQFKLCWPESMQQVPSANPSVPVTLKTKKSGFPSFTVVVEPGTGAPYPEPSTLVNRTLSSYRLVGFTDVKVIEQQVIQIGKLPALELQLQFSKSLRNMQSRVLLLPITDRTLTFTLLHPGESPLDDELWESLLAQITLLYSATSAMTLSSDSWLFSTMFLAGGFLLLCLGLAFRYNRKSRHG